MPRTLTLLPLLAFLAVAACETVEGVGRDVETAGGVIAEEAQDAQTSN
jgi:predicted small secreted protein